MSRKLLNAQPLRDITDGVFFPAVTDNPPRRTIGANIRRLRGTRTQIEIASALGVPPTRFSDWERDRHDTLDSDTLLALAKALQCSVEDLLADVDAEYSKFRRDLVGQASDPSSSTSSSTGGVGGSTADQTRRLAELERRSEQHDALVATINAVLFTLGEAVAEAKPTRGKGGAAGPPSTRRGRSS